MNDLVEGEEVQEEVVEIPKGFIKEEDHQKRINVQHKKYRDEERARVAAEEERAKLAAELEELRAKSVDLTVPPIPDPYDESYEEKIKRRDEAIRLNAEHEANQKRLAEQKEKDEAARAAQETKAYQEKVAGFESNLVKHGLDPSEVTEASKTVLSYGISETFQDVLVEDDDGPLFVAYLAQNPLEIEEMKGMSTLQLLNHLNGDIRQKASLLKPQTSRAPDPPMTIQGGGVPELQESWEKGAKYE